MAARYLRPTGLEPALAALAEGGLTVAAGCTDLFPATWRRDLAGDVLDITAIDALKGVSRGDGRIRIGAATTWSALVAADLPPAFDGLKQAAREVGARQIQNSGTIGGNLCNASPAADGVPPLLTLDAAVELCSARGAREAPLSAFITGPRATALAADEILTAILIPESAARGRGGFLKLGARRYLVISIAMAAVRLRLEGGVVAEAALSIGACGPVAARLPAVEAALTGAPPDPARITDAAVAAALSPIGDIRADAAYRARAAAEILRRAVAETAESEGRRAA